jgi:hypothetical protein
MRRTVRAIGQMLFDFHNLVEVVETRELIKQEAEIKKPTPEPAKKKKPLTPPPAKQRRRTPVDPEKPSVTFHKHGRKLLVKPNNIKAALAWADVRKRLEVLEMRNTSFFGIDSPEKVKEIPNQGLDLWKVMDRDLDQHPWAKILRTYGVDVLVHPVLSNWLAKESRRQKLEGTPFPTQKIETNVSLFDRCAEGTVLACIKDYEGFKQGQRYLVVSTGEEGKDAVVISTDPMRDRAVVSSVAKGKTRTWTAFDLPMEEWFDDSEEMETGKDITELYPAQIEAMERRLKQLNLKLYEHVEKDVVQAALKRGSINAYKMRMGKTSFGIAWALLRGSERVAWVGPRNARIFTVKELKRLGFEEDKDYVIVNNLADLEKEARFYLITSTWLRRSDDPGYKARSKYEGLLRPSFITVRRKDDNGNTTDQDIKFVNNCPHCSEAMKRYDLEKKLFTTNRGYMCLNKDCVWVTDNRNKAGAAWNSTKKLVRHKGGYVDIELAAHALCPDIKIPGRMCPVCKVVDGVWEPGLYKRLKKRFTAKVDDEIHNNKTWDNSRQTLNAQSTYNINARAKLGMTGTLISNGPVDTYWPLHYVMGAPSVQFPYSRRVGLKEFDARFCDKVTLEKPAGVDENGKPSTKLVRKTIPFLKNPRDFWKFTAPKIIRRIETDEMYVRTLAANGKLVPKQDIQQYQCQMDVEQAKIMLACIQDFRTQFQKMQETANKKKHNLSSAIVISQMSILRSVATCPDMLNDRFESKIYKGTKGGGKLPAIKQLVEIETNTLDAESGKMGKVVILSDFIAMRKLLSEELRSYNPILFNSSWDDEAREEAFDAFQNDDSKKLFIAGTRAIREGTDLCRADACICADMLWSPGFQSQSWSRIMTPTDKERTCRVYLLTSKNSVDDHMYTVFYSKYTAAIQAMDRKMMERRNRQFDVQSFVEKVLEEENAIQCYLRESGDDTTVTLPEFDLEELSDRE